MRGNGLSRWGPCWAVRLCWFAVSALILLPLGAIEVTLHGRVVDENGAPVPTARVTVRPPSAGTSREAQSGIM